MNTDAAWKGLAGLMIVVVGLMGFKTIDRNQYWKNDSTLFGEDIKTVPNSVLVNANVAASYITLADYAETKERKQKYLKDAIVILDHTLSIHRKFVAAFLNRGIAWYKLDEIDKARANIDTVKSLYPTYPTLPGMYKLICDFYLKKGWEEHGKLGDYVGAIEIYKKGLQADSSNLDLWYNMGGAYFTNKQFPEAVSSFQMALRIDPNNQMAKAGLNAAVSQLNQVQGPPGKK
jgi:tetratricopeptide (TPR) repeat protein